MNPSLTTKGLASNVPKFYVFSATWMFVLTFTINVVFFRSNGLSISQVTLLDILWAVLAFCFEVPTGALADRWSRKYSLVLSGGFTGLGMLLYSISSRFWPFALATVFMAARQTLYSGTANALIYDSLKAIGRVGDFEKVLGRARFIGVVSVSVAGILGAYLGSTDIRLPFRLSILTSLVAVFVALTFKEPPFHRSNGKAKYFEHIRESAKFVLSHPLIRFLFLYFTLMDIGISHLDEYDQIYLTDIGFPLAFFGVWIGLRRGLGGLGSFFAGRFKAKPAGRMRSIALAGMIGALLAVSLGSKYVGLSAFLIIFPLWGVVEVLVTGELHSQVESYRRATVESLIVFFAIMIDVPVRLAFGLIGDRLGIRTAYLFLALILVIYLPHFLRKNCVWGGRV
jgi:MFS family permease